MVLFCLSIKSVLTDSAWALALNWLTRCAGLSCPVLSTLSSIWTASDQHGNSKTAMRVAVPLMAASSSENRSNRNLSSSKKTNTRSTGHDSDEGYNSSQTLRFVEWLRHCP